MYNAERILNQFLKNSMAKSGPNSCGSEWGKMADCCDNGRKVRFHRMQIIY